MNNEVAKEVLRNAMWEARKTLPLEILDKIVTEELQKMMDTMTTLSKSLDYMENKK